MPNGDKTLTPAGPEATSAFLGLDEAGRQTMLGKLSPDAKQALLLGLRTLSQSKQYGTSTAVTTGRQGFAGPPTRGREPTIGNVPPTGKEALTEVGIKGGKELAGQAKWIGAGAATALAGPGAGVGTLALAAGAGGATGEAIEELGEKATGLGTPPTSAKEFGMNVGKAGLETASAEFLWSGGGRILDAVGRHLNPYTQGIQSLFRSFGPPSSPEFRDSLETAAFDLQRIYSAIDRKLASPETRGGVINEDMRFRVTLEAVNNYLRDMYQRGRAAQIAVGQQYGARVVLPGNPNVIQETARRLSRSLPTDSVAQRAATALANNPLRPLPIDEADELARAVNVELRKFEGLTGSEQAALRMSSKIKAGLKELDTSMSQGLNSKLREIGQPGLEDYERRYAALSRVREQLEKGMNKSEAVTWNQRLHSFFSLHGINIRSHFGAFETPGSLLEEGLSRLGKATIPEPGQYLARPPQILEGELMPPEEETGLATTPPRAGPPPTSGPIQLDMKRLEQERTKGLLPPPKLEKRAAPGVSPTGTERRKTIMPGVTTAYDLPTEGEKLGSEVRKARAGAPSGITEADALKEIMQDPQQYARYKAADQKTRDRMLVEIKNKLQGAKRGGMKPPPKTEDFDF